MTQTLDSLNRRFAQGDALQFSEAVAGLPVAEIHTPLASARVALQGAHVLAWQPSGQAPVLWVSKAAVFEPGTPVRGGVPVCWPWFGAREGLPAHGFVRNRLWQMRETGLDTLGQVTLRLGLSDDADTRALWDHAFDLELEIRVGTTLSMSLVTRNTGHAPLSITQALHSYFCVRDITQVTVQGLDGVHYLDKVRQFAPSQQSGSVRVCEETDRIYTNTTADCLIEDAAGARSIRVAKQGNTSTVVWNPWSEREKTIADMAPGEFRGMLCVETCNAGPDVVTLIAGQSHTLSASLCVL